MIDILKILAALLLISLVGTTLWLEANEQQCQACSFEALKQ